ncbi:MAG: metallophosphoesterase family protein [Chthoniobacterales bacterium]|nr:metallophosphoesterase family protein [Chthoniobacterales bacterium]
MRIAVIADTHNRLPDEVADAIAGADEIWHLGDVCNTETLALLQSLGPPVSAVRGNCDPHRLAPDTLKLRRGARTFYLVHEPPGLVPDGAAFALHGHTHVPRDETCGGVRYLNPGSVGKANHGAPASYAWLTLEEGCEPLWKVITLATDRRS